MDLVSASFLTRFWLVSGPDMTGASLHLFTMTDSLRLNSNRLSEPDLAAPLPSIGRTYSAWLYRVEA